MYNMGCCSPGSRVHLTLWAIQMFAEVNRGELKFTPVVPGAPPTFRTQTASLIAPSLIAVSSPKAPLRF